MNKFINKIEEIHLHFAISKDNFYKALVNLFNNYKNKKIPDSFLNIYVHRGDCFCFKTVIEAEYSIRKKVTKKFADLLLEDLHCELAYIVLSYIAFLNGCEPLVTGYSFCEYDKMIRGEFYK